MWTVFKFFPAFVTILLLLFVFCLFGHEACGVLAPWPGIELTFLALEGEVLTTGLPQKSSSHIYLHCIFNALTSWGLANSEEIALPRGT